MKDLNALLRSLRSVDLGTGKSPSNNAIDINKDLQKLLSEKKKWQYFWVAVLCIVFLIGLIVVLYIDNKDYFLAFFGAQGVVFGAIIHHLYSLWKEINATKIVAIIAEHGSREEILKFTLELVKL